MNLQIDQYKRGDVWLVELDGIGSEQRGLRPCLITSNDISNKYSPNITIVAITSQAKAKLPVHVQLYADKHGMKKDCVLMVETVRTISKERLREKLATLDNETMELVNNALRIQLGLDPLPIKKQPIAV